MKQNFSTIITGPRESPSITALKKTPLPAMPQVLVACSKSFHEFCQLFVKLKVPIHIKIRCAVAHIFKINDIHEISNFIEEIQNHQLSICVTN